MRLGLVGVVSFWLFGVVLQPVVAQETCKNDNYGNTVCRDERGNITSTTNRDGAYSDSDGLTGRIDRERGTIFFSDGVSGKLQPNGSIKYSNGLTCWKDSSAPDGARCY